MRFINRKTLAIAGAAVALVAVGSTGTAVAGSLIGSSDIQDGSIRSIDVKDGSLKRADLSNPINRYLARITKDGVEGPKGAQGAPGVDGKDATLNTYVVQSEFAVPAGADKKADASVWCNEGDRLLSGGFSSNDNNNQWTRIYQNRMDWSSAAQAAAVASGNAKDAQPDGWYVQALGGDHDAAINLYAYCTTA